MANTMQKGAERRNAAEALRQVAGTAAPAVDPAARTDPAARASGTPKDTVMIGAHFPRPWRRALAQVQIDPRNDGKKLNDLLAEALTDLYAKYAVPQPDGLK
jgi:hypothetical protein